jgi:hypothetical protein
MAVMKHRTFDNVLRAIGIGEEGYGKPNNAQIENTKNIAARVNRVYFDILVNGDSVSTKVMHFQAASL